MLTITVPGEYFLPEYTYITNIIFHEWLGVDFILKKGMSGKWIISTENQSVMLPNIFFPEHDPTIFYDDKYLQHLIAPYQVDNSNLIFPFGYKDAHNLNHIDLFGSIFYFITCYEDTFSNQNKFNSTLSLNESFAYRYSLLQRPFVDEMIKFFVQHLQKNNIAIFEKKFDYNLIYSCDIDIPALSYRARPSYLVKSAISSLIKYRSLPRFFSIFNAYSNLSKDFYYTFPFILAELDKNKLKGCFNLKGGITNKHFDHVYDVSAPWIQKLLKLLATQEHEIGFHPSYDTPESQDAFLRELTVVRQASPSPVVGGRQHYLRFMGSKTWEMWDNAGLQYDSTVGFNRASGFRLGTAREFPVYDLLNRKPLKLRERPLIVMDCTLFKYERLNFQEAFDKTCLLSHYIKKYGGNMTLLWHNSFLDSPEKKELFSQLLKYLS